MKFLPLSHVRLSVGPFAGAVGNDLAYALKLDPDRLLAPYRREAGLPPIAESYGNWESSGLDGHIGGHYLSALAFLSATTGDPRPLERLEYALDQLAECQDTVGTGYLGGVPGGRELFEGIRADGARAASGIGSAEHWVPWYNLHKVFQGLIDVYTVLGIERALAMAIRFADWWLDIAAGISDADFETMLDTEFGAMNDSYAQLALITGNQDYARMAARFSHRVILDPLLRGEDNLDGRHANTQIPKATGYAHTARALGDPSYLAAARTFWDTVVNSRTVAIGGNSVREHFHSRSDFSPMIEDREGPEFCNTYNMLKLTRALAEEELRPEHLDFAERALFNHVLGSQHPTKGGFVYFTSIRPRHYRVYSQPHEGFWCCVGTGLEAQARYAEWIFGTEDEAIAVNLYTPAEAEFPAFATRITVHAELPDSSDVMIQVDPAEPREFTIRLRVPSWAGELEHVAVNGRPVEHETAPGAVLIRRAWTGGDTIRFQLPLASRTERLPDGSPWQAYLIGPYVFAAPEGTEQLDRLRADDSRMGHIASGPLAPVSELPLVEGGGEHLRRGRCGKRHLRTAHPESAIEMVPFAELHDERYTVYFPIADGDPAARRAELAQLDAAVALDSVTIDSVALGEQQPEADHLFRGANSVVLTAHTQHWRTCPEGITLTVKTTGARTLRISYLAGEEDAAIRVSLGGTSLGETTLSGTRVFEAYYAIPFDLPEYAQLSFEATAGVPVVGQIRLTS